MECALVPQYCSLQRSLQRTQGHLKGCGMQGCINLNRKSI